MSEDEVVVLVLSALVALGGWGAWTSRLLSPTAPVTGRSPRHAVLVAVLAAMLSLLVVLKTLAADDVRSDGVYVLFYLVLGAAWLIAGLGLLPLIVGLSIRDDVAERGNAAAAWAAGGFILGLALAFSGANVGNGPGWWVVVFSAGLSSAAVFVAWWSVERFARTLSAVLLDRDPAAGLRTALFLVSVGLIAGRGAAGDWVSASATVDDFVRVAWPIAPLTALEIACGRLAAPSVDVPEPSVPMAALFPGGAYLAIAAVWLLAQGTP